MSYKVKSIHIFERQAKRLIKKYPSLKKELSRLIEELISDPFKGTVLGHGCYKIRLAIASKGKGKSGGARIITNIVVQEKNVYLLTIFDKSEADNISNNELEELLRSIPGKI